MKTAGFPHRVMDCRTGTALGAEVHMDFRRRPVLPPAAHIVEPCHFAVPVTADQVRAVVSSPAAVQTLGCCLLVRRRSDRNCRAGAAASAAAAETWTGETTCSRAENGVRGEGGCR